jgi:hypothetical protein
VAVRRRGRSASALSVLPASLPHVDHPRGLSRGSATWLLYVVLSCLSFLLNGLGAILVPLQKDLHVDRNEVAFYPTLFAVGLVMVGVVGGKVVGRVGGGVWGGGGGGGPWRCGPPSEG